MLHYVAMDMTTCENTDPIGIYHFIAIINNNTIVDKIAKHVRNTPQMLQDAFEKALILEAGLQGRHPQVMQVSIEAPEQCGSENSDRCVHQLYLKDNKAGLNTC